VAKSLCCLFASGLIMLIGLSACSKVYQGPVSNHFDGSRFFMAGTDHGFSDMLKWLWEMETVEWPEWIEDPVQPPPPNKVGKNDLRLTYVNHATVLIQTNGLNILTDPIWSLRAGLFSWLGVKRIRNPGFRFEDLPKIDLVLISHDHYDHLDLPTLVDIAKRDQPTIITGLGLQKYLKNKGIRKVVELDWWQSYQTRKNEVTLTFVPALHSSGRWPLLGNKTLWGGYVISSPQGNIYFAGDTGYGDFINQIARQFSQFRLTILPIGSYEKRWFMKNQHMNPEDAVKAHLVLDSKQSVGIHYGTFAEHPEQTVNAHEDDLFKALAKLDVEESEFWIFQFGEGRNVKPVVPVTQ
jgi:L-ascorbate metabolism protein UlaG (beta-lactamase superfamily)